MGRIEYRAPWVDDEVPIWGEGIEANAESLADAAPGPVAFDGAAEGAGCRESETRPRLRGGAFSLETESREQRS